MDNKKNSIVIFINQKKNDRQPDLTGKITIDGKEYEFSAWTKTSKNGKDYYSGVVKDAQ